MWTDCVWSQTVCGLWYRCSVLADLLSNFHSRLFRFRHFELLLVNISFICLCYTSLVQHSSFRHYSGRAQPRAQLVVKVTVRKNWQLHLFITLYTVFTHTLTFSCINLKYSCTQRTSSFVFVVVFVFPKRAGISTGPLPRKAEFGIFGGGTSRSVCQTVHVNNCTLFLSGPPIYFVWKCCWGVSHELPE